MMMGGAPALDESHETGIRRAEQRHRCDVVGHRRGHGTGDAGWQFIVGRDRVREGIADYRCTLRVTAEDDLGAGGAAMDSTLLRTSMRPSAAYLKSSDAG